MTSSWTLGSNLEQEGRYAKRCSYFSPTSSLNTSQMTQQLGIDKGIKMATILNAPSDGIKWIITEANKLLSIGDTISLSEATLIIILGIEGFLGSYAAVAIQVQRIEEANIYSGKETVWIPTPLLNIPHRLRKEAYQARLWNPVIYLDALERQGHLSFIGHP